MDQLSVCPEMALLASCLPVSHFEGATLNSVHGPLDWNRLVSLAGMHGFLPLLSAKLAGENWSSVPSEIRSALEAFQLSNTQRCLAWSAALTEVQAHCRCQGIPIVSWKGPLLAKDLYGKITLREYADLDFLVKYEDLPSVTEVLLYLGYTQHKKSASEGASKRIQERDQEICFVRSSDGIYLELHTQLMPARFSRWQNARECFDDIRWRPRAPACAFSLPPDKLLLTLCAHGLKHSWERLKWLADIALLVDKYREAIDWEEFIRQTEQQDKEDVLLHGLWLASSVFSIALPVSVVRAAHGKASIVQLTQTTFLRIMSGLPKESNETDVSRQLALFFPYRRSRLLFLLRRVFEPQRGDFDGNLVVLSKLQRLHKLNGLKGIFGKTAGAIRATFS